MISAWYLLLIIPVCCFFTYALCAAAYRADRDSEKAAGKLMQQDQEDTKYFSGLLEDDYYE